MFFNPNDPSIDHSEFSKKDWARSKFDHPGQDEELPGNILEPRGMGFVVRTKVDTNHTSYTIRRRSRIGFPVYLNSALVHWISKK